MAGYLEHRNIAELESAAERFFMNVSLVRVLYTRVLVGAPSLALGRFAPLGRVLGDPRFGMAGVLLSLRRVVPNRAAACLAQSEHATRGSSTRTRYTRALRSSAPARHGCDTRSVQR